MKLKYWLRINKETLGPLGADEIQKVSGISENTLVCPEGATATSDWRKLREVPELAQMLSGKVVLSPLPKGAPPPLPIPRSAHRPEPQPDPKRAASTMEWLWNPAVPHWAKNPRYLLFSIIGAGGLLLGLGVMAKVVARFNDTDQHYFSQGVAAYHEGMKQSSTPSLEAARDSFTQVIEKFPQSPLVPQAKRYREVLNDGISKLKAVEEATQAEKRKRLEEARSEQEKRQHEAEQRKINEGLQNRAVTAAEGEVKGILKSPSTMTLVDAKLLTKCKWPYSNADMDGYLLSVTVDSQNGFGAMIRSSFMVLLFYDESSNTFKINREIGIQVASSNPPSEADIMFFKAMNGLSKLH